MSSPAQFTIDFIQQEYRDSIKTLMQILCIDLKSAYQLFMISGCNIQAAINNSSGIQDHHQFNSNNSIRNNNNEPRLKRQVKMNKRKKHSDQDQDYDEQQIYHQLPQQFHPQQQYEDIFPSLPRALRHPAINQFHRVQQQCQFDIKFNKYLQFIQKKRSFNKNYRIRKQNQHSQSIAAQLFNKKLKHNKPQNKQLLNHNPYYKQIQSNLLNKKCYIKFGQGSMSQSMQRSFKKEQPLILYHLAFDKFNEKQQKQEKVQKIQKQKVQVVQLQKVNKRPVRNKKKFNKKQIIDITEDNFNDKLISTTISNNNKKQQQNSLKQLTRYKKSLKNRHLQQLLKSDKYRQYVNQVFLNYIFDTQNYQLQSYFKQLFPKNKLNQSYLLVIRVNILQQYQVIGKVNLDEIINKINKDKQQKQKQQQEELLNKYKYNQKEKEQTNKNNRNKQKYKQQNTNTNINTHNSNNNNKSDQQFIKQVHSQLKLIKSKSIKATGQQSQLLQRYNFYIRGIYDYDYRQPITSTQKKKIKQDQQLIRQQQAQFLSVQSHLRQQKIKQNLFNQNPNKQQPTKSNRLSKQQLLTHRQFIRQQLTQYSNSNTSDIMTIKFRLPSGKNILYNVSLKQKLKYLFDYIYSHPNQNLGFEEEQNGQGYCQRLFDILRPQDRLILTKQKEEQILEQIFQGSTMENLVIKEK